MKRWTRHELECLSRQIMAAWKELPAESHMSMSKEERKEWTQFNKDMDRELDELARMGDAKKKQGSRGKPKDRA